METHQPWSLLALPVIFMLLLFCVYLADSILQAGKLSAQTIGKRFKSWWRRHIVSTFPHPSQCFECNKTDCGDCPVLIRIAMKRKN